MTPIKIPTKKLSNGFEIPIFGIGTWEMGGRYRHDPKNNDQTDIKALETAINLGVTHIDTAEIYANGYTETLVGKAIKKYNRSKLFIVSKVAGDRSPSEYLSACEASLKRLDTRYLNLYLVHWYENNSSLKEKVVALNKLVERGFIKYIGVSNFNVEHLREAQSYTKYPIVCNQVHYNLIFRESERTGLLEYCQRNDVMLVAWRPIEKGRLTKLTSPLIKEVIRKYDKTPAQIAINWLISQMNVVTIAKSSSIEHLKDNLGAVGWEMDKLDIEKIRADFPGQQNVSNVISLS